VQSNGEAEFRMSMRVRRPWRKINLPRVGVMIPLPAQYNQVEWMGRGPHENYRDRSYGAHWGIHHSDVDMMYTPYIKPQEYGNRWDVERVTVSGEKGGLEIYGNAFSFSIHPFTLQNLTDAEHTIDLVRAPYNYLYIDLEQNALGSENFFYNYLRKYILKGRKFSFGFGVKPVQHLRTAKSAE
jgi:beta-galactosidase